MTKLFPNPKSPGIKSDNSVYRQINATKEESIREQEAEGDEDAPDDRSYDDNYEMEQ